jgi:hypothetical protein
MKPTFKQFVAPDFCARPAAELLGGPGPRNGCLSAHSGHRQVDDDRYLRRCVVMVVTAPHACARAMPIDTAVAAITSETASATVANSSMPTRRLENLFSITGDAKPTFPVSSVILGILRESVCMLARIAAEAGAGSAKFWRSH